MKRKLKIADAGNTVVPAFLVLRQKGYNVRCDKRGANSEEVWIAESPTTEVIADDPVTLLGLAAIAESRGSDWKATDEQIEEFLKMFGYGGGV